MEKQTKIDRISNLPWDVLDTILVHLPLRDTARTSILSSKWRYQWTGLSQFVLDDKCFRTNLINPGVRWREIKKILDHIQLNHSGSIEKFKLSAYCCPDYSDLDQWIHFLTEKGIKEFILLEFNFIKRYKLPSFLFTCTQLSCLEVYGCVLKLPSTFKGLNCLKSLQLIQVSISGGALESLILNSPVLERLTLLNIDRIAFLKIQNPSLSYLKLDLEFEDICLDNCPCLTSVYIRLIPLCGRVMTWSLEQTKVCNIVRVFDSLSGIKRLALSCTFLEFLGYNNVPERLPTLLHNLSALELKEIRFNSVKEVMASLSILGSSPNLEELVVLIGLHSHEPLAAAELLKKRSVTEMYFNQLKVVKIRGFYGSNAEWEFVKYILAASPVLETMTVVKYGGERVPESMFQQLEIASQNVKFISLTL